MLTIALLATLDPAAPALDLPTITGIVTSLGVTGCLLVGIYWLVTGRLVPKSSIDQLQGQIAAKDAALQRKDEQIQALQTGIIDKVMPAITEANVTMRQLGELIQTDVSLRDPRRS